MNKDRISFLRSLIEPILEPEDIELIDLEFKLERGAWVLRLYIDTPGGITLKHCELVSRQVGAMLDMEDPVEHSYTLEVSSPGINRVLRREKDFVNYAGSQVKVKTRRKLGGKRNFRGILMGMEDNMIVLDIDGKRVEISPEDLEHARLDLPESELFRRDLQKRSAGTGD
ncbi:MAG: ribosome maturation factor RimP [Desulfomonile sp.]|nr:ribosome maturation factor RimP [Desulfomonile sp.]